MKQSGQSETDGLLPIRVRRTLLPDGVEASDLGVFCERRHIGVDLSECLACGESAGLSIDARGDQAFLRCRADTSPPPAPDEAEQAAGATALGRANCALIRDVMTTDVTCVHPELALDTLELLFLERGIGAAPVIGGDGRALGVVSKTDLVRERHENADGILEMSLSGPETRNAGDALEPGFHIQRIEQGRVKHIMTPIAFAMPETASVARTAAMMAYEGVHHTPVVSADGRVVGIVSSLDLLRWLAKESGFMLPARGRGQRER